MALAPIDHQGQLEVGGGGPQLNIQAQRALAAAAADDEAATERSLLHQLRSPLPGQGQGVLAVVRGDVPGIPELPLIPPTPPFHRPGELRRTISPPELLHTLSPDLNRNQAVGQTPVRGVGLQDNRVRDGCSGARQTVIPLEGERLKARGQRKLHPGSAAGSGLARERGPFEAPRPGGQANGQRFGGLGLQLHQPPGLSAAAGRQQRLQPAIALQRGLAAGLAPLGLGLLEHLGDRGARKDVVKLLKEQRPPIRPKPLHSGEVLQG